MNSKKNKQPENINTKLKKLEELLSEKASELERKNNELEIESSLERVRAIALNMHKSENLLNICEKLFQELKAMGFDELRNTMINIHNDKEETFLNYDYSDTLGSNITSLYYDINPIIKKQIKQIRKSKDAFSETAFKGDELKEWKKFRKKRGEPDDPRLKNCRALHYYFYSIGTGSIGISTFNPISKEKLELLKKYRNVFDFAYRRYIDVALAEEQAKEAKIETSLERVRTHSMVMKKPEDLLGVCKSLFNELLTLGFKNVRNSQIVIFNDDNKSFLNYDYSDYRGLNTITIASNSHPIIQSFVYKIKKSKEDFAEFYISGKELASWKNFRKGNGESPDPQLDKAESIYYYFYSIGNGAIGISAFESISKDELEILKRFRNVFDFAYKRYTDVAQAVEQAKEAQIEASLERVRAIALGMRKSRDLLNVGEVLFNELKILGFDELRNTMINIHNDEKEAFLNYDYSDTLGKNITPLHYNVNPIIAKLMKQIRKSKDAFTESSYKGDEIKEWKRFRKKKGEPDDPRLKNIKALYYYLYSIKIGSIGISTFSPISKEKLELLKKFRNVFEFAYRRYADVAKAEEQAKEAQIELSLERIRARSMAMHKSDELVDASTVVFDELKTLGIETIRTGVAIVDSKNDTLELWSSQLIEGKRNKILGVIPFNVHPFFKGYYKAWKRKEPYFHFEVDGIKVKEYYTKMSSILSYPRKKKFNPKEIFYSFFFSEGSVNVVSQIELTEDECNLLIRFAKVFGQMYRRFLDLQKAEALAKEAQTEVALERVRSRTMAMHHSNELQEAAILLFQQIKSLGIDTGSCGYIIWEKNSKTAEVWMSSPDGGIQAPFKMPHTKSKIYREIYSAGQSGKDFFVKEVKGNELVKHFDYLTTLPGIGEVIKKLRKSDFKFPEKIVYNNAFFKQGYLSFHTHEQNPEAGDIFKRFAKVFEQIYTRFLDLQKAEEQAREAQIELGLERVRARAMAMQHSGELSELVDTVFKELTKLDFALTWCIINIIDESSMTNSVWAANPDIDNAPEIYHMKFEDYPFHDAMFKGWKERDTKFIYVIEGSEKLIYDDYLFSETEFRKVPKAAQKASRAMKRYVATFSFSNFGGLQTVGEEPLSEDNLDILERFGKVFDLTYTRFNDLLKAEAQAREAQIEASLEKVRSRSLAMHKADELGEVITVIVEKLRELDFSVDDGVALITHIEGSKDLLEWMVNPGFPSAIKFYLPYFEHPVLSNLWKVKNEGAEFIAVRYTAKENKSFLRHIFKHSDFKHTPQPIKDYCLAAKTYATSIAFQKHTAIFINDYSGKTLTEQEIDILKRFSKVFEQAYIRFLDLQKAEAQAKEAQIELALERVRARTMAMQKSDELGEVSHVMNEQLQQLNFKNYIAGFLMDYKNSNDFEIWRSDPSRLLLSKIYLPYFDHPIFNEFIRAKKEALDFNTLRLTFEEKNKWLDYALPYFPPFSEEIKDHLYSGAGYAVSCAYMKNVGLYIENFNGIPFTEEENTILSRFGKVFEQTYTRFLDLQKAEAQARESQIEAALERVRSRTMGMQKSEELKEVIQEVYDQFVHLNINIEHTGFIMDYKENDDMHIWLADSHEVPSEVTIPYFDCAHWNSFIEAKEKGLDFFTNHLSFKEKNKFYKDLFKMIPGVPEETKEYYFSCPGLAISTVLLENVGLYIENFSGIPYTDEENNTLMRFGKVFQQTYTRFKDLKQAEAQAREAQIEAAMERVRTQALTMHNSEDFLATALVIFKVLNELGIEPIRTGLSIVTDKKKKEWEAWSITKGTDENVIPTRARFTSDVHPVSQKIFDHWKRQVPFWQIELTGDPLKSFLKGMPRDYMPLDKETGNLQIKTDRIVFHYFSFPKGVVFAGSEHSFSPDEISIMKKFTNVFSFAYTRYQDLEKAEAQAREAQIEAALEKVRGKAMAMHNSADLTDAAGQVFTELNNLGFKPIRCGFVLLSKNSRRAKLYPAASFDYKNIVSYTGEFDFTGHPVYEKQYESWQKKVNYFPVLEGEVLKSYYKILAKGLSVPYKNFLTKNKKQFGTFLPFTEGFLFTWSDEPYSDTDIKILDRFKAILDLTIRRYLDLQKAESQAREAKIEAALERARTQSMLMQHSNELNITSQVFHEQLQLLGIDSEFSFVWLPDEKKNEHLFWTAWTENPPVGQADKNSSGTVKSKFVIYPLDKTERYTAECFRAWESNEPLHEYFVPPDEINDYFAVWAEILSAAKHLKAEYFKKGIYYTEAFIKYGCFGVELRRPLTDEEKKILLRFAIEFERAYTRFLDLQKAEAQAREAQIEASLERVRSRTLAMHKSDELAETSAVVFQQLIGLGIAPNRLFIGIINDNSGNIETWATDEDGLKISKEFILNMHKNSSVKKMYDGWKSKKKSLTIDLQGKELTEYFRYLTEDLKVPFNQGLSQKRRVQSLAYFSKGFIGIASPEPQTEDTIILLERFASVFNLTFTRFNDLKQAEAQAREAQVEVALERVRSRTMAMQKSDELSETAYVLYQQFMELGDSPDQITIGIFNEKEKVIEFRTTMDGKMTDVTHKFPYEETDLMNQIFLAWKENKKSLTREMKGKELHDYIDYRIRLTGMTTKEDHKHDRRVVSVAFFSKGVISISTTDPRPKETVQLLERFAGVFDLTYRRFLDLKNAEQQTYKAKIEGALERVRARALAMQEPEELVEVAEVLRHEMGLLGVEELETSSIYIHDQGSDIAECWYALRDPKLYDKKLVSDHITIDLKATFVGIELLKFFNSDDKTISIPMTGENRKEWVLYCYKISKPFDKFYGDEFPDRTYHLYKFSNGAIGAAAPGNISEESWDLLKRTASVFSLAYSRFKDLTQARFDLKLLKEEKKRAEEALAELKATQSQLIQSEKMASLGELTAGIAHEIQNPLNFVNNFSEVNTELIDELNEELSKGNFEDAKELAKDIKDNEEKIKHHGKRAEGIVKGMLQHSRTSSGVKEPTDINLLADEYLRLAYHGLRAKDKSFNVKMETDFDESIGKINIIPQDIGRVILNLITNAFYVVDEKKKKQPEGYEPVVKVSTEKIGDKVKIKVKDNGNGIAQNVLDKIFQPFFTTKPTGKGTGLGLSLSYDIVKAHGGELTVETKEGEGSEFLIILKLN